MQNFNNIEEAIEDIKNGKMIIVMDDFCRENEGDLVMAAEMVKAEDVNFMAKFGRGLICTPCDEEILRNLDINEMVECNTDNHGTAFTVSIDHVETTTGISAHERALTIRKILDKNSKKDHFRRPGHIFPLIAKKGGVLKRDGHTEAAVDLSKLAGLRGAGVICEIMNDDGTMARLQDLLEFSKEHDLKIISIKDLKEYIKNKESNNLNMVIKTKMPTKYGEFTAYGFLDDENGKEHVALVMGDINLDSDVLVRIHSECLTGDVFLSNRCDCGEQLKIAMEKIAEKGSGILLYMRQEGRGIGLINKLKAYELQDCGLDTLEANLKLGFEGDMRKYDLCANMLKHFGVKSIKLMTNNEEKIEGIEKYGIKVNERIAIETKPRKENIFYLKTKKEKMNHLLNLD